MTNRSSTPLDLKSPQAANPGYKECEDAAFEDSPRHVENGQSVNGL